MRVRGSFVRVSRSSVPVYRPIIRVSRPIMSVSRAIEADWPAFCAGGFVLACGGRAVPHVCFVIVCVLSTFSREHGHDASGTLDALLPFGE
jgi:hypothetical protein